MYMVRRFPDAFGEGEPENVTRKEAIWQKKTSPEGT